MKTGLLSIGFLFISNVAFADCKAALEERLKDDLNLTYQQFDQTDDAGFRLLENRPENGPNVKIVSSTVFRRVGDFEVQEGRWGPQNRL